MTVTAVTVAPRTALAALTQDSGATMVAPWIAVAVAPWIAVAVELEIVEAAA